VFDRVLGSGMFVIRPECETLQGRFLNGDIMKNQYLMGLYTAALIVQDMAGDKESPYSHKIMQAYQKTALMLERDNDQRNN
jgi:hypothetical protein